MTTPNYEIYRNIMSDNPVIDKEYISQIIGLSDNQVVKDVELTEVKESNTALVIKVAVQISDTDTSYTKHLFIKTVKRNQSENMYHSKNMREGLFYKLLLDCNIHDLPVPLCYDSFISDEKGEFLIVLEDISNHYAAPNSTTFADKNIWFSCAESLAQFHAAFWNHEHIAPHNIQSKTEIESTIQDYQKRLHTFLNHFGDKFDLKTKTIIEKAMEINIALIREFPKRLSKKDNVTIQNGDSHIYNFMLPIDNDSNSLIVDFQFWGEGIGAGDLAHLTRVSFSDDLKRDIQHSLIEHYYKTLKLCGVTGYSWERCLNDYRAASATMVLIPFFQYTYFGIDYNEWSRDLQGLIYNYEYLQCNNLELRL